MPNSTRLASHGLATDGPNPLGRERGCYFFFFFFLRWEKANLVQFYTGLSNAPASPHQKQGQIAAQFAGSNQVKFMGQKV